MNARRAHDVRALRACTYCKGLAMPSNLLALADGLGHVGCFVEVMGESTLLSLPRDERGKVRRSQVSAETFEALLAMADEP